MLSCIFEPYCVKYLFMKVITSYKKDNKAHLVEVIKGKDKRIFRLFSKRAALAFMLLIEFYPKGITTADMRERYQIDDNKLFGELLDQSGFREYLKHIGTENRLKVRKLEFDELWKKTEIHKDDIIWYGINEQGNLNKFLEDLVKRDTLRCNILGIPLYIDKQQKFLENFRKVAIDHRRPLKNGGVDVLENLQLLSYYVNERKNQICAICSDTKCEQCSLAYPEKFHIVYHTNEDMSELLSWRKSE